jgi:hypothetical protein
MKRRPRIATVIEITAGRVRPVGYVESLSEQDGYWCHVLPGHFFCFCPNLEQSIDAILERSGAKHRRLPAVSMADVTLTPGKMIDTCRIGCRGWYRQDTLSLDGTTIGRVQVKVENGRTTTITINDTGGCVLGRQWEWLLAQHGRRLVA